MAADRGAAATANPHSDVVVVGYGPVGQTLALLLADRGHHVGVVERHTSLYPLPRAVTFDHEAARILQRVGLGDTLPTIMAPLQSSGPYTYEWRNGAGQTLLGFASHGIGPSGWPNGSLFCQPELERLLDDRIRQHPNVAVFGGVEATGASTGEGTVTVAGHTADNQTFEVSGRFVIGCDGANSAVRQWLDVDVVDLGFAYDWLVVDVIPVEDRAWDPPAIQLCDPARPTTAVPGGPGRRRFEFMRLPAETEEELAVPLHVWGLLEPWGYCPENATLERSAVYTFRARWALPWRVGRTLLAGDAAHQMPPFAGQGLCSGLRDATNLAWRLDLVLNGEAPDDLLDGYEAERSAHVQQLIALSVELGKVICVTDPGEAARRDNAMLAAGQAPSHSTTQSGLSVGGAGTLSGALGAGALSVQGRVRLGGRVDLADMVFGAGFVLLSRAPVQLDRSLRDAFARIGGKLVALGGMGDGTDLDIIEDLDGTYDRWLSQLGAEVALVRPDFYVFGAGAATEAPELVTELIEAVVSPVASRR